jgi:hypothetical protein
MAADDSYVLPLSDSQNEDFSDEVVEIVQVPELPVRKKSGRPAKGKQNASTSRDQENVITPELETRAKIPTKISWVWDYFVKKCNEKGEMRAYCQFVLDNGEQCTKSYKHDGSTGNLSAHIISKHGITPPTIESFTPEIKSKPVQSINKNGQKEKEESTLRWILLTTQPLSTVTQKAYIKHMDIIDPEFIVPGEKKIRMMIACSYSYNKEKLKQLLKTAQSISLTTDLWSSRSKHGYLGLTATWINQNFEIVDVLLEISYFPAPHTAEEIANKLKNIMQKWEIEDRVVTITTDNGANIVAAVRKLEPIKRLSCAAHTLQLAIGKGLKLVESLAACAKQLINFFSTQKQVERLIKVQKDSGYEEPLHLVQDISTR